MADLLASVTGFPAAGGLVDLEVRRGDFVLLTGPNGSGKTSLLRALAGLRGHLEPVVVEVAGTDPRTLAAARLVGVVRVALQDPRETLVGLTVAGEFRLRARPMPAALDRLGGRDVATLSSGEARRVSLAVAGGAGSLLLLDEPSEGLDAGGRDARRELVAAAQLRGAVVVADQSGTLAGMATRTVSLGFAQATPHDQLAPAGNEPVVTCPAHVWKRAGERIALPALELPAGFHVVVGPNGSGKSTLLLALAGLLEQTGALIDGSEPVPGRTVRVLLPRAGDLLTRDRVDAELSGVQGQHLVPDALLGRHPLALSAGEAQRVALAKVLCKPAPVYLLDEPEAHLDAAGFSALVAALGSLTAAGCCVLAATHDEQLIALAHRVVRLEAR